MDGLRSLGLDCLIAGNPIHRHRSVLLYCTTYVNDYSTFYVVDFQFLLTEVWRKPRAVLRGIVALPSLASTFELCAENRE